MSSGAGAESRQSIGTGVFGGVLAATLLGLVFAPVAFHAVASLTERRRRRPAGPEHAATDERKPDPARPARADRERERQETSSK
jgi:HAE1 family hydrophobic/amphiphilic exporter-1